MNDELDLSWAEGQIAAARVPVAVGRATIALLRAWGDLEFPNESQRDQALKLFTQLAKDEAVSSEGTWHPVVIGGLLDRGDRVRIRSSAFDGAHGRQLNGRLGRVIDKRSGSIIVRLDEDGDRAAQDVHLAPKELEFQK